MSTNVLHLKPNIATIQELVIQRATTQWRSIGTELLTEENDSSQLGIIKESYPNNHKQCCYDMFDYWLQNYPNATWEDLLKALRSPAVGHNALATAVEKEIKSRHHHGTQSHDQRTSLESQTKQPIGYDETDIGKQPAQDEDVTVPLKNKDFTSKGSITKDDTTSRSVPYPPDKIDDLFMKQYPEINKDKPAFAIIFDNEHFHDEDTEDRTGTEKDGDTIRSLEENFKGAIVFHEHILKDLTADEMKGAFKMLGKPNLDSFNDQEMQGAIKLFHPPSDCAEFASLGKKGKILMLKKCQIDFTKYNCFMAFIMSHGNEKGIAGIDNKLVTAETLSGYITPKECKQLENKPKIFFIQTCRGKEVDIVNDEFKAAKDDVAPNRADFLYVYATPENYKAVRSKSQGSMFIQTLVGVMKKTLYHYHLEEILLFVKNEMGQKTLKTTRKNDTGQEEDIRRKQILSVVSQMRGRIFFAED